LYNESSHVVATVSSDELQLLCSYLPSNLNIDEAAFRRQLVTSVHTVLSRLRDSSLLKLRRTSSASKNIVDVSEAFGQWHCRSFAVWFAELSVLVQWMQLSYCCCLLLLQILEICRLLMHAY